ncbi:MAG: hypothetical protein CME70_24060 [Halobacteriovorax sp.]|nr:hypothetical protein [Halobacteriovorax sp.]|tara:strand:- start:876 stop:1292 length:417 start_codon:yes stop_codon:yes gene_type:complete
MKRIGLLIFTTLFLNSAFTEETNLLLGGVDVGNGRPVSSGFELKEEFKTEIDLIEHFDRIKEQIKKGEHPTVKGLVRLGRCNPNKIDIPTYHFKKFYDLKGGKSLKKKYRGAIQLGLYKCKNPEIVRVTEQTLVSNLE